MAELISEDELLRLKGERNAQNPNIGDDSNIDEGGNLVANLISEEELQQLKYERNTPRATIGDYLKTVPATGVDITFGAAEGLASAVGAISGDYDLARNISEIRTDVNDAIMGDAPESLKNDFAYKLASGLGSTIPFLGAALLARRPDLVSRIGANGFFLASAGQQVRDDYLASQGVTSETATDEQMSESNKAGAIGAVPIALAEKLGAGLILRPFAKGAIPAGEVVSRITQYISAGIGEGMTEVAQSGIINGIASYVNKYDPDRPITQGMAESALVGFLVGGGVNASIDTIGRAVSQTDRLKAGIQDGSINAKDVIDPDIGGPMASIAMENGSIPEVDTLQQSAVTDPKGFKNFISKTLTPLSRRLGRAGKEVVREFRKYELDTGRKITEFKEAVNPFSKQLLELKKKSPEDYFILASALANSNELGMSLPESVKKDLEKRAQIQPELNKSKTEQFFDATNPQAGIINSQIERAREGLANMGLDINIRIIDSGRSYYDSATKTIAISATESDTTTVGHEFLHAALGKVAKTDLELQAMTRNMFDSVIRATTAGSTVHEQLKGFVSQYEENVQNEEFLAQTVGELASQYSTLDLNAKTQIKVWINQVMQKLGMQGVFAQAETDSQVIDQLNAFARFSGTPEALTDRVTAEYKEGNEGAMNAGFRATKFVIKENLTEAPIVNFNPKARKNSNVTKEDSFDIISLLNDAVANNKKVVIWQADQFGIGTYRSPLTGKKYDLDGGLGFAKSIKNGRGEYVWSTSSVAAKNAVIDADLVLIASGDPSTQHYFNRSTASIVYDNIVHEFGSLDKFIAKLEESTAISGVDGKLLRAVKGVHNKFPTKELLLNQGNARKLLGVSVRERMFSKDTGNARPQGKTPDKLWESLGNLLPEASDINDNHLIENNFGLRDIYGAFTPNGKYEENSKIHGTYGIGIGGEFLGTPDRVVNVLDILNPEFVRENIGRALPKGGTLTEAGFANEMVGNQGGYKTFDNVALQFKETTQKELDNAVAKSAKNFQLGQRPIVTPSVKGTPAFKKWFGKGVLVHDNGEPMVMYHGTKEDFTEFKPRSKALKGWTFFSSDPDFSAEMAMLQPFPKRLEGNSEATRYEGDVSEDLAGISIMPAFLNAKEIFDPRNSDSLNELQEHIIVNHRGKSIQYEIVSSKFNSMSTGFFGDFEYEIVSDSLKSLGYDGIILSEFQDTSDPRYGFNSLAVWNTNGIKSATANTGAYNPSSPDIRYQKTDGRNIAREEEILRGIADDGLAILQKYGMTDNYREVRKTMDTIKEEYTSLGLDTNFIDNYFPRLVNDLEGLKRSYGKPTGIVDQEVDRYEKMTGQRLSDTERQMIYEKLARSQLYRGGISSPSNLKERRTTLIERDQMKFYADPEVALDSYIEKMVNAIETKKLIGDSASGKTAGADPVSGRLGKVMDDLAKQGRLRQDQIDIVQGAVEARFGQHGSQYSFVKGAKNMGYLATMGNTGSALTQLGDFYFTMVQNGLIPTLEAVMGKKVLKVEDLGLAKDMVSIENEQGAGMFAGSVKTVFKLTGLTAMDRLAKNTNINAALNVLTRGAKANQNSNKYKKTLARLKRTQGNDAYKTIADLQKGKKSDLVIEALYNELADVAPISLTEMPENYAKNPNLRIMYSLKSYTIKQFNFLREKTWLNLTNGIAQNNPAMVGEASVNMMKILAFSTLANGSADVLKAILFNRDIDEEDFMWNTILRMFGITKYTTVKAKKDGLGSAIRDSIMPPQFSILDDIGKDITKAETLKDARSSKYFPLAGKLYYWREGRGVDVEDRLSRLREKD